MIDSECCVLVISQRRQHVWGNSNVRGEDLGCTFGGLVHTKYQPPTKKGWWP